MVMYGIVGAYVGHRVGLEICDSSTGSCQRWDMGASCCWVA